MKLNNCLFFNTFSHIYIMLKNEFLLKHQKTLIFDLNLLERF